MGRTVRSNFLLVRPSFNSFQSQSGLPVTRLQYLRISRRNPRTGWLLGRLTSLADRTRYGHEMMATNEFQRLLLQNAAFTPPFRNRLSHSGECTHAAHPNVPHSIAEELWHIVFWQDHFLRCARQEDLAYPQHAQQGWPEL